MTLLQDIRSTPFAYGCIKLSSALRAWPCTVLAWFQLKSSMSDVHILEQLAEDEQGSKLGRSLNGSFDFTVREISPSAPFYGLSLIHI